MREGEGCWVSLGEGPEGLWTRSHICPGNGISSTLPQNVRISLCVWSPQTGSQPCARKRESGSTCFVNSQPACLAFQSTGCHDIPSLTLGTFQAVPVLRLWRGGDMKAAYVALYAQRRSR